MQIDKIQNSNQTSFGIKYVNKKAWNKDVLKAFEESKIFRGINAKYPDAEVRYTKISGEDSIGNAEIIHTLLMDIKLAKNKFFRWNLSSHSEMFPEQHLKYELKILNMKDIEEGAVETLNPTYRLNIKYKQNPIKAFFQKIFHKS